MFGRNAAKHILPTKPLYNLVILSVAKNLPIQTGEAESVSAVSLCKLLDLVDDVFDFLYLFIIQLFLFDQK